MLDLAGPCLVVGKEGYLRNFMVVDMKVYTREVRNCMECPCSSWVNVNRTNLHCNKSDRKVIIHRLKKGMTRVYETTPGIETYIPEWCKLEDA